MLRSLTPVLVVALVLQLGVRSASANLLANASFEATPCATPCNQDQGIMPSDWLVLLVTPDTFSNDGSYGLSPNAFGNFPGVLAQDGIRWVAGWSGAIEIFGQTLSSPLVPGQRYVLRAYLRQAVRLDLANPGTYQVELWDSALPAADKLVIGTFDPPIANTDAWEIRSFEFTAPAGAATHAVLAFRPLGTGAGTAYPGLDNLDLDLAPADVPALPPVGLVLLGGALLVGVLRRWPP